VTFSYTAIYTNPVLYFGIQTVTGDYHYFDDVSVVDVTAPSVQLLQNPSFDNSTMQPTGWDEWCVSTCNTTGGNAPGLIVTGSSICHSSPYKCLQTECGPAGVGIYFIGQSFPAIIGHMYTISFWHVDSGLNIGAQLYADVF
jgi:hypothetical protein